MAYGKKNTPIIQFDNKEIRESLENTNLEISRALVNAEGQEFNELKEVLDDKDNKIDVLSTSVKNIAINVTEFGAKFDNTTDDIKAINDTINYVSSLGGGTVLLPRGSTKISSSISLKSQVILKGNGRDVTFIVPTFDEGEVIGGGTSHKQKARIEDLTIKPTSYKNKLAGINYKYLQYGTVSRVDVWRCGIGYYFDGSSGCYYNKQIETRAVSCGWGVRTITFDASARPNSNEIDDLTILSPIISIYHGSGNTNLFRNIKTESLESIAPHPTVDFDGTTVTDKDRWVLKLVNGTGSNFEKFRAEFDGNLVSLASTYGHFLRDFYCNFNGEEGAYIKLEESPSSAWQTNNLIDVELGRSLPYLSHEYYNRHSRLGQMIQFPPQVMFTPRDTAGAPTAGTKGYVRFDANGKLHVATADNTFETIFYDKTASPQTRGPVKYHKASLTTSSMIVTAGGYQSLNISTGGLQANDNVNVSVNFQVPDGLIVSPPYVDHTTFNTKIRVYNPTTSDITLPAGTWTAAYVRP